MKHTEPHENGRHFADAYFQEVVAELLLEFSPIEAANTLIMS